MKRIGQDDREPGGKQSAGKLGCDILLLIATLLWVAYVFVCSLVEGRQP